MTSLRIAPVALTLACAAALLSSPARADVSAAARAFSEGQAAQMEGKFDRAADSFELAYSIKPSKEALRSAARMRLQAGHVARAANQAVLLLSQYPDDPPSVALAKDILAKTEPELCQLVVTCAAPGCSISADGRALSMSAAEAHTLYLSPGEIPLEFSFEGAQVTRDISARAGVKIELRVDAPPRPVKQTPTHREPATARATARTTPRASGGWPRTVVYAGAGVTAALGGVTLWSALDTQSAHDDYVKAPTHSAFEDGEQKQLRTNILLGATAATALATAAIALFHTDWKGERLTVAPVAPNAPNAKGATGATVILSGSF